MLSLTTKNSHNTTVTMPGMLKSSSSSTLRQPPRPLLWLCSAALHRLKLLQPSAVMHHVDSTLCLRCQHRSSFPCGVVSALAIETFQNTTQHMSTLPSAVKSLMYCNAHMGHAKRSKHTAQAQQLDACYTVLQDFLNTLKRCPECHLVCAHTRRQTTLVNPQHL